MISQYVSIVTATMKSVPLINGFDHMVSRISTLITEVYEGRIHQKEYEMRALRAQINPHFLYNSLSLINWKAIESGQEDISRITLELSNYYRTSLNKGRNTLTLEQELSNVRSYLQIQQLMHDGDFDVEIDVAAEILQYESLNLILQPLVENAIDHGIDLKTEGRGRDYNPRLAGACTKSAHTPDRYGI